MYHCARLPLVDFVRVDLADECLRAEVTERAAHDAEPEREQRHVTEIEYRLKHAVHSEGAKGECRVTRCSRVSLRLEEEVIRGVEIHVERR